MGDMDETTKRLASAVAQLNKESKALYEAASAYRALNVCFRLGSTPSEALFKRLDKADKVMAAYRPETTSRMTLL